MPDPDADPAFGDVIRGSSNRTLVFVRSLQRRDRRARERAFVVEGARAVGDALLSGARPRLLLLREGDHPPIPALPPTSDVRVVAARLFDDLSDTVTPQGLLAVFPFPDPKPPLTPTPLALVLDRIRDPGNLGTLLRAAAGAGAGAVFLSAESVDPFNPKAVRAGMGAHFRVPLRPLDDSGMVHLRERYPLRVVAVAEGDRSYDALDWRQPAALIVGSEADGIGPEVAVLGTTTAAIPLAPGVESLNAAVAGAVILFEAARQRRGRR